MLPRISGMFWSYIKHPRDNRDVLHLTSWHHPQNIYNLASLPWESLKSSLRSSIPTGGIKTSSYKVATQHHEDIPEDLSSSSMIYNTLRVSTSYGSITFPATHLPRLILNYRIAEAKRWDFKDSHGSEAQAKIEDILEIPRMLHLYLLYYPWGRQCCSRIS
jgi:hypothetical protein